MGIGELGGVVAAVREQRERPACVDGLELRVVLVLLDACRYDPR
jgi:hypothetical protein